MEALDQVEAPEDLARPVPIVARNAVVGVRIRRLWHIGLQRVGKTRPYLRLHQSTLY